jgi:exonuclease V gamma subunit
LERARAEGRLPLRRSGLESFADQRALAEAIADLAARFDGGRPVEVPVDLKVDGVGEHPLGAPPGAGAGAASVAVRVRGRLHLTEGAAGLPGLLLQRCAVGKEDAKRLLRLWIPQLVAGALGLPCRAVLVHGALVKRRPAPDLKGFSGWDEDEVQGEVALQHLRELLRLYRIGMGGPLPLFPRSSLAFAGPLVGALGVDALLAGPPADGDALRAVGGALGKAAAAYDAAAADFARLDVDDPYVQRLCALRDPLRAPDGAPWPVQLPFAEAALRLWGPALARRRTRQHILKGDEVLAW